MPVQAKGAVFSAEVVPSSGGETGWADMCAAYDALAQSTKTQVDELSAYHSLRYSQGKLGFGAEQNDGYSSYGLDVKEPPLRPLVKVHPETGRKALTIGRHAYGIPGLSEQQSETLLDELCVRLPAASHLSPSLDCGKRRGVGQSLPDAPSLSVGHAPATRHVSLAHRGRPKDRGSAGRIADIHARRPFSFG
jgi:hypothetical protein